MIIILKMKMTKIKLLLCILFSMIGICVNAQQTSLTIESNSPGWLSSKIGYGDQLTVKNLKVIGYLNNDDLKFIVNLARNYSLNGRLDMEDANFVGNTDVDDNYLIQSDVIFSNPSKEPLSFSYFSYPKSLKGGQNDHAMSGVIIDTLFINTTTNFTGALGARVNNIVIGNNVSILKYPSFNDVRMHSTIETVTFPSSLKEIRETWNIGGGSFSTIGEYFYIKNGKKFKDFPSLERMVASFKIEEMSDSLFFPSIKVLSLRGSMFKDGIHVFIGENIDTLEMPNKNSEINLHFSSSIPPRMERSLVFHQLPTNSYKVILYVPKGSVNAYRKCFENNGTNITIYEEKQPVTDIMLEKHELTLDVGESHMLKVNVEPSNADNKKVIWNSDNPDIVSVNTNGEVKALKSGETIIRVISEDGGYTDSCKVNVIYHVTDISLNETSVIFDNIGERMQLVATINPPNAYDKRVIWKSSNNNVCTVLESGIVVAMDVGNAIITATSVDGGFVATCMVTVLQPVTSINLNKHTMKIRVGSYEELHVTVSPDNASDKSVSWSSSDHNVIDVDDKGMVTARNAGKAFVIVKSKANDILKDSCEVIVLQPVTGVIISEPTITFGSIGSTKQLSATVLPNNASDKSVRWESSNVSICMVSDNGLVVAVGTGTAVVSVTTIDGGYIAVCVVTVTESDGIMTMEVDDLTGNEQIYDIQGKCIQSLQKGINIIRMNDGTIKKVIVK